MSTMRDPNTLSNYSSYLTTHVVANLEIHFEKESLSGNVLLNLRCLSKTEQPDIVLDSSYLDVDGITLNGKPTNYELQSRVEPYGSALRVKNGVKPGRGDVELDVGWPNMPWPGCDNIPLGLPAMYATDHHKDIVDFLHVTYWKLGVQPSIVDMPASGQIYAAIVS